MFERMYVCMYVCMYICVCMYIYITRKHTAFLNSVYFMFMILKTIRDYCPNPSLLSGLCNEDVTLRLNTLGFGTMQSVNSYRRCGRTCFHYLQDRGGLRACRLLFQCVSFFEMLRHFHLLNVTIHQLIWYHISEN
jgi:hypothetical protein